MKKKPFSKDYITLADMYLAYRKAKAEAFFDSFHSGAVLFSLYEENIKSNIESLYKEINSPDTVWTENLEFIGGYRYVPKSLDDSMWDDKESVYFRSINPVTDWRQRFLMNRKKKASAEYRLIILPTVNYQIISALWILKVGHKFEAKLDKELSYGNRLRRKDNDFHEEKKLNGVMNHDALGLFSPYFQAYKKWRGEGLNKIRELIEGGYTVTAITMDIEKFYHRTTPDFLLRSSYLKKIGVELSDSDKAFTHIFLNSIKTWYRSTPDHASYPDGALPVGLSASKIISNVLLYELDYQVADGLNPDYYGRYVDDIFIVFKAPSDLIDGSSVLTYLSKKIECVKIHKKRGENPALRVRFGYANDCVLNFTARKQKIFSLSGIHGLDFIDQISNQIKEQSSEYRMLPELPKNSVEMANKALLASPDASLTPDALRKADVVSIRRLGFSLLLKDIESYSSDLESEEWCSKRREFYGLVERYILTPKGIFDFSGYLHRVFKLMITNNDFEYTSSFIEKLNSAFQLIGDTTYKLNSEKLNSCKEYFQGKLYDVAIQSSTDKKFRNWEALRKTILKLSSLTDGRNFMVTKPILRGLREKILLSDLGVRAYKDYWYYSQEVNFNKIKAPRDASVKEVLRLPLIWKFKESVELLHPHWPALAFPTRPLTIQEIALICPDVLSNEELFKSSVLGLRGAKTSLHSSLGESCSEENGSMFNIPNKLKPNIFIALTNYYTSDAQFILALEGKPDQGIERYEKVNALINSIIRDSIRSDYIVFPECSLPLRWAMSIAQKLARQQISLIAGIEYYNSKKNSRTIRNDCLLSLVTNWPGYNSNVLFLQAKETPSHGEKKQLEDKELILHSSSKERNKLFPIYKHGSFHFGAIICSDLTNPSNRHRFQGLIDCLFVLEWNPDVKTFSYLVEGTSHDTHSFVVQVNNRAYGDSRVRAPYRADYKRDSVRVKGGVSDTYVIASIDYNPLRKFQRRGVMTDNKSDFKPVPVGFKISKTRK